MQIILKTKLYTKLFKIDNEFNLVNSIISSEAITQNKVWILKNVFYTTPGKTQNIENYKLQTNLNHQDINRYIQIYHL